MQKPNKARESIEKNPLATVLGGIALGAISAALLPKTRQEDKHLGPLGQKARARAKDAALAAKENGIAHLDSIGINREAAASQFRDLVGKFGEAVSAAGSAAAKAARNK